MNFSVDLSPCPAHPLPGGELLAHHAHWQHRPPEAEPRGGPARLPDRPHGTQPADTDAQHRATQGGREGAKCLVASDFGACWLVACRLRCLLALVVWFLGRGV